MTYSVELIWSNNAQTTIANSISNTATTVNLASGSGTLFPSPSSGQGFTATFTDQATGLLHEIVLVTGRSGDTITTMQRAQEGTTGLNWTANDLFAILWTSGAAATLVQQSQLQEQAGNYAVDTGSVNAYIAAFNPVISAAPSAGTLIRIKIAGGNTNTAASTLNAGWGAVAVHRRNGSALIGGELVAGIVESFIWNGATFEWQGIAPATAAAITAGTDGQSAVTPAQLSAAVVPASNPTTQVFDVAGAFTYTPTTAGVKSLWVRYVGAGGGGGGTGASTGPDGADGTDTIFNGVHAKGGGGGTGNATSSSLSPSAGGAGGTGGSGSANLRIHGQRGGVNSLSTGNMGGGGGNAPFFGGGALQYSFNLPAGGLDGEVNTGGGGGGSFSQGSTQGAAGGGGAEYVELFITATTYTGTVGTGGLGGQGTGTNGQKGGDGAAGKVIVIEYYKAI